MSDVGGSAGLDLVLFDLDGTITDSQSGIAASYRHTLGEFGLHADEAAIRACIGPPLQLSLASLGIGTHQMEEAVSTWRAWFVVNGIFDNAVYQGVPPMLDAVRHAGLPIGLATSKLRRYAVDILDHFALRACFDVVAGATGDGRLTTKDEIIADALLDTGIAGSERVLMIGDRSHDILGALACGVVPVGVTYGYGSRAELVEAGARWVLDSPAEVAELILGLTAGPAAGPEADPRASRPVGGPGPGAGSPAPGAASRVPGPVAGLEADPGATRPAAGV